MFQLSGSPPTWLGGDRSHDCKLRNLPEPLGNNEVPLEQQFSSGTKKKKRKLKYLNTVGIYWY
jgi:hypothetical protein